MGKINKIWGLEEMEKRVENLRKLRDVGNNIDIYLRHYMSVADDRLDALYLTYHHVRGSVLKYDRETFGELNDVEYIPKETIIYYGMTPSYASSYVSSTTVTSISPTSSDGWYVADYTTNRWTTDYIDNHNEVIQGFIDYGNTVEE